MRNRCVPVSRPAHLRHLGHREDQHVLGLVRSLSRCRRASSSWLSVASRWPVMRSARSSASLRRSASLTRAASFVGRAPSGPGSRRPGPPPGGGGRAIGRDQDQLDVRRTAARPAADDTTRAPRRRAGRRRSANRSQGADTTQSSNSAADGTAGIRGRALPAARRSGPGTSGRADTTRTPVPVAAVIARARLGMGGLDVEQRFGRGARRERSTGRPAPAAPGPDRETRSGQ